MKESLAFLTRLEVEAKRQHAEAVREREAERLVGEATKKVKIQRLREAVKDGGDAAALAPEVADAAADDGEPVRRRYLVNNTTV